MKISTKDLVVIIINFYEKRRNINFNISLLISTYTSTSFQFLRSFVRSFARTARVRSYDTTKRERKPMDDGQTIIEKDVHKPKTNFHVRKETIWLSTKGSRITSSSQLSSKLWVPSACQHSAAFVTA